MSKIMKMVRYFSVAALASLLAQSVWAAMPAPVASWTGAGLATGTENNGYTISYGDGASFADNVITLTASITTAYQGVKISLPEGFSGEALTVTVKYTDYSNPSANRALFSFTENDTEEINGYAYGGTVKSSSVRYPNKSYTEKKTAGFAIPTTGMMYFSLDKTSQGLKYGFATGDETNGYNAPDTALVEPELKAAAFKEIHIGGCYAQINWYHRIGLKISEIKVYDCTYDELIKNSMPDDYKVFADNFAGRIVTWTTTAASASTSVDIGTAAASFKSYNAMIGENVGTAYAGNGTNYSRHPGGSTTSALGWTSFCSAANPKGYTSPGLVLRFPTYQQGTTVCMQGSFGPLCLGGLIVEEGASSGNTIPNLAWKTADRISDFGVSGLSTFFILKDSLNNDRGGTTTFYGDVTIDIAEGKMLKFQSGKMVIDSGCTLKLNGAGKIRTADVVNAAGSKIVDASGRTLDFSGKTSAHTFAYFDGGLTVSDTTTIIFPDSLSAGTPFTLCTGTLTAPTEPVTTTRVVGGKEQSIVLTYNATAKTVTYTIDDPTDKLADDLIWLPIGDSITEGEQYMGHAGQGDVDTRGGYRYQLWREMEEEFGQSTISVGYRTGHQGTVEDPKTCHWAWHAAQYGGAIMYDQGGTHGAAGLCLDSTLEVAGYPDVITVLIGVNDCSFGGAQVSKVFDSWVAMITKLSAKRPKSTICVSTLLPAGGGRGYIDTFNTLVRAAVDAKAAPFNLPNVVFADMHQEAFGGTFDAQYFKAADKLHPNENGAKLIGAAFSKYLKDVVADRATHAAELVSIDNGTAGYVTVRFNKALKSVTSATLTITGTDVEDTPVTLTLTNGAIDETNKRLLKFATSEALKGGTYTATITNLVGADGNGLALPASLSITDSEFVEILGTGAENNVPAAFRSGLAKHGTLAMGDDNFAGNGPGEQFTKNADLPQYVKRVAYYMELKRPGQPAQFVWASMDASTGFGSRSINVGIPTSANSNVKAIVNNLQVYGNRGNFTNSVIDSEGNSSDTGIVEFTPWTWTANDQSGYPADFNGGKFGWNDTLGTSTLKGCMQIAKILRTTDIDKYTKPAAEMLFAYNNFNCATATDIAIGSFSTHRHNSGSDAGVVYDWTDFVSKYAYTKFAADAYEVKSLEIWAEEGEAPQDIYIAAGETVTANASNPLTLPVRGSGRLVLENYLPTNSNVLESLQNSATWTGTVEIKNYTKPDSDNYGIIYFQNYANANSTIALNGVTSTIYTNGSNHPDQTFGSLEIMSGGWTSHNGMYSNNSPLYNCKLTGSGAITINHRGAGTVYFCGDHSNFSGSINFAANADKGVVLAPAGNARTTTGPAARQILIHANTTVRIAGTANGRVKLAARTNPTFFDVRKYGNDETIVEIAGIDGDNAYPINGTITSSPKVVLAGDVTFSNGFGGSSLTWSEVSGTGNFTVSKSTGGNQNYVISTLKGYTGAITAKNNTTLTIGEVVTTLASIPATSTKIVKYGSECAKDKVIVTNLAVKLANGTDITSDINITVESDGIYVVIKPAPQPTEDKTFPEGTIITKEDGTVVEGTTIPDETGLYTVKASANGAAEEYGVVKTKDAEEGETPTKVTTAVAVPFKGKTVATLLNTALLAEGDTLMAWIDGGYEVWTLQENKTWKQQPITRAGGNDSVGIDPTTATLKCGQAVWVTTAGKIVTFGDTAAEGETVALEEGHNLLGNPTMEAYTPEATVSGDQIVLMNDQRCTAIKEGETTTWITMQADKDDPTLVTPTPVKPEVGVGQGFWFIKK